MVSVQYTVENKTYVVLPIKVSQIESFFYKLIILNANESAPGNNREEQKTN